MKNNRQTSKRKKNKVYNRILIEDTMRGMSIEIETSDSLNQCYKAVGLARLDFFNDTGTTKHKSEYVQ